MTLSKAKALLQANSIPFTEQKFASETDFFSHISSDWSVKNDNKREFYALTIESENGKMHLTLEFEEQGGEFIFYDLWFGDVNNEYFIYGINEDDLLEEIRATMQGDRAIIIKKRAKNNRWLSDSRFFLDEKTDDYGESGFQNAMKRIRGKKSFFERLLRLDYIYEVYDWNSYERIVK